MGRNTRGSQLIAAGVHSFTALGSVAGFMALRGVVEDEPAHALLWLGAAMIIDGLDGPLARHFSISTHMPSVDGAILDNVIDYLTYALVPAIFLYRFELVPGPWGTAVAAFILMTSLYTFANRELKTADNFFNGFPATWNFVVLGFYLLETGPLLNVLVILGCGILTFAPLKFIHPFRVRALRPLNVAATVAWAAATVFLILQRGIGADLLRDYTEATVAFLLLSVYFLAFGLVRSVRGRL
ncbi:MAG: CDP-alcohol phosphatidyltransferase family protein [Spirochaetaceae bacterium]